MHLRRRYSRSIQQSARAPAPKRRKMTFSLWHTLAQPCDFLRAFASASSVLLVIACSSNEGSAGRATKAGDITTWAGSGTQGDDGSGHLLRDSWLNQPMELAFAPDRSAIIVDWNNHALRRATASGTLVTVIGQPLPGDWPCQTPGDPAACQVPLSGQVAASELALNHPLDVVFDDAAGSFFIAAWHNHKVLHYSISDQTVSVTAGAQKPGAVGDGGPGSAALFNFPASLVRQADGSLLVSDERNNRIRRLAPDAARTVTTVAGAPAGAGTLDEGVSALAAALTLTTSEEVSGADNPPPGGALALDAQGNLYLADTFHHCVRRIAAGTDGLVGSGDPLEETIHTVAGVCGHAGDDGDGGDARQAHLNRPFDLEVGPDGALYVADTLNHRVRRVELDGNRITSVAGSGVPGFAGDGGPANEARLREPYGIAFDEAGNLFIADTLNQRIREVLR